MGKCSTKCLQFIHLLLIAAFPILYGLLRIVSEPHDWIRRRVDVGFIALGSLWVAFLIVHTVIKGEALDARATLLSTYRARLTEPLFLILSNLILFVCAGYMAIHLLRYRQVEFISNADCFLVLERDGKRMELGILRPLTPTRYRVPVSGESFLTRDVYDQGGLHPTYLLIPPIWENSNAIRKSVNCKPAGSSHP
jgi:hypothetical protein